MATRVMENEFIISGLAVSDTCDIYLLINPEHVQFKWHPFYFHPETEEG